MQAQEIEMYLAKLGQELQVMGLGTSCTHPSGWWGFYADADT